MGALSIICVFSLIVASISSLPIQIQTIKTIEPIPNEITEAVSVVENEVVNNITARNMIRPGMQVTSYSVEITPDVNSGTFNGRLVAQVTIIDASTREDPVAFAVRDLTVNSVSFALLGGSIFNPADFDVDDDILEIDTGFEATLYTFVIEYSGSLNAVGRGLYTGHYDGNTYLAMNLHPTHARSVFPCLDEPSEASIISFTFNDVDYTSMVGNSLLEDNSASQFRALEGPPHRWGMVAHNFVTINVPTANVVLMGRSGLTNQESQASVALNYYFNALNEWTNKPYFEIIANQDSRLHIMALPDVSRDWYALSMIGIWEPYVFMERVHSVKQRYLGLSTMAEALASQWFGYVIYPENWRFEWVITGLSSYAAFDVLREFQSDAVGAEDISLLDINTLFVTEIIQESLYRDAYGNAQLLEHPDNIFEEEDIRDHIYGLVKYKAPAILRMLRLILGDENEDFIQRAARALLNNWTISAVNSLNFIDAINSDWLFIGNGMIDEVAGFLEPWLTTSGYPLINVGLRQGGVLVTQERFGFSAQSHVTYEVPITYTTSVNPDFDNIYPIMMMDATTILNMALDEEDFVLFNIQGQGYYRVNYDRELWERIIEALNDPDRRAEIHPLNRATLVDDALNLARASVLDYDLAFEVVLSMMHETEYAVWKAFVRNMNFLRIRLVALVTDDDDLDPDIYLRMVRRSIVAFEEEIGFSPDPLITEPAMTTLTRGLVMEHACRANYEPCIAAAVDWFYDPNSNEPTVNPEIPKDIRPAVYCTMVKEAGDDAISALYDRLEIEPSSYERVVILEALACSDDDAFIRTYLEETIASNSPYSVEERVRIFKAVAESSYQNARIAVNFISRRTSEIRDMYGGPEKLEEIIFVLADNLGNEDLSTDFNIWLNAQNNNLDDSEVIAVRAMAQVTENLEWINRHMDFVYEWIEENDAPTLVASLVLISISFVVTLFNH